MGEETPRLSGDELRRVEAIVGGMVSRWGFLSSGAAGEVFRLRVGGDRVVAKRARVARTHLTACEAEGLRRLEATATVAVPRVVGWSDTLLVLEDVGEGLPMEDTPDALWRAFGEDVGALHAVHAPYFGYERDNYLGIWRQRNPPTEEWLPFFLENRVTCYLREGNAASRLTDSDRRAILRMVEDRGAYAPRGPAVLCHGDLWSENTVRTSSRIYVIDPAVHYGLAEADLANACMYRPFPAPFWEGYRAVHPLDDRWRDLLPLYQVKELVLMVAQFADQRSLHRLREMIRPYR